MPATITSAAEVNVGAPLRTPAREQVMEGLTTWINESNGFRIIDLEYRADPAKRSDQWLATIRAGIPTAEFNREYGSTWIIYEGKPVYGTYSDDRHMIAGDIIVPKRSRLICGWDGGPADVNLAWSMAIARTDSVAVQFIDEYYVDDGDVEDFVQVVGARMRLEWTKLRGFVIHVADQSVFTPSGITNSSMADTMRKHGMPPIPGEISFAKRRVAVNDLLVKYDAFKVHERCTLIREAFGGGYIYPKMMAGIGGMYKETPLKNKFSHLANTIEYVCSRMHLASVEIPYENVRVLPQMRLV